MDNNIQIKCVQLILRNVSGIRLKYKMLLVSFLVLFVPVLILSIFFINRTSNVILEQNTREVKNNVMQISENFKSYIELSENISDQIYVNNTLQKNLLKTYTNPGESSEVYQDIIYPLLRQNRFLHSQLLSAIKIYTENSSFLENGSEVSYADPFITSADWYTHAIKGEIRGYKIWDTNVKIKDPNENMEYTFSMYRCLNNYLGQIAGVLELQLFERQLMALFDNVEKENTFFIFNNDGNIITSNNRSLVGRHRSEMEHLSQLTSDISEKTNLPQMNEYQITYKDETYIIIENLLKTGNSLYTWQIVSVIPLKSMFVEVNKAKNTGILISIFFFSLIFVIIMSFSSSLSKRINLLVQKTHKVVEGELDVIMDIEGNDEISELSESFNIMLEHLNELINEVYENKIKMQDYEIRQKETELIALQNQINPHFLYNTLDAIRMHAILNNDEEIGDMLVSLSALLRYNISRDGEDIVTIEKEIQHVNNYFNLMQIRYENKFEFQVSIDPELLECKVLKLILQPIVENAIHHGLRNKRNKGLVSINICEEDQKLVIQVIDDGQGMDEDIMETLNTKFTIISNKKARHGRIGLVNVNDRIKLLFGDGYGISVNSLTGQGTKVQLILPLLRGEDSNVSCYAGR